MERGYLLVTPLKDEAEHLEEVIRHVAAQTMRPVLWVLVDDRSTDGSTAICRAAARRHPWIRVLSFRGREERRRLGPHVYQVVRFGYESGAALCRAGGIAYGRVGFLDADMLPDPDYFERLGTILDRSPRMGIVSGGVHVRGREGPPLWEESPLEWPWGGARLLSRACLESIGGVMTVNSGDAVAAIRAMAAGYRIGQFREIRVVQVRPTSTATGAAAGYFQKGIDDYVLGYSLPYVVAKAVRKGWCGAAAPWSCYMAGYLGAMLRRRARIDDPVVRDFCRWRLLRRLAARDLPPPLAREPEAATAGEGNG